MLVQIEFIQKQVLSGFAVNLFRNNNKADLCCLRNVTFV